MSNGLNNFIKNACANWVVDRCIGTDLLPTTDGKYCCFNEGRCFVMDGRPCRYFERAVLPCANQAVATQYGAIAKKIFIQRRKECACGRALPARRRMCDLCAKKQRQAAYRKYRGKRQKAG